MYYLVLYTALFSVYHYICPLNYTSKYFLAHVIHNFFVIIYSYQFAKEIIEQPFPYSTYYKVPIEVCSFLGALHVYHLIFYKISFDEIYHHILSIYFHFYPVNKFLLASLFFMTGLPGGITYVMLILIKYNYISKITEKIISKNLNLWCRLPGILFFANMLLINMLHREISIQDILTLLFMFWNPLHFAETIIVSYTKICAT